MFNMINDYLYCTVLVRLLLIEHEQVLRIDPNNSEINVTDRRTDGQATCNLITALCIASRGKKLNKVAEFGDYIVPYKRRVHYFDLLWICCTDESDRRVAALVLIRSRDAVDHSRRFRQL